MISNGFSNLPLGFGMGLIADDSARQNYESLSEAEKEEIILRCKDAKSKDEMDKILNSLSTPGDVTGLLQAKSMD